MWVMSSLKRWVFVLECNTSMWIPLLKYRCHHSAFNTTQNRAWKSAAEARTPQSRATQFSAGATGPACRTTHSCVEPHKMQLPAAAEKRFAVLSSAQVPTSRCMFFYLHFTQLKLHPLICLSFPRGCFFSG